MRARIHRSRVTHERWLVSYADFITLLFGFFVVLYAFARADEKKKAEIPQAIDSAFTAMGAFPDYSFKPGNDRSSRGPAESSTVVMGAQALTPNMVKDDLNRIRHELEQRLAGQVAQHTVIIKMGRDGLVISLREAGFFNSGSAIPRSEALLALRKIAASLAGTVYDLRVEGHTDNVPIHTPQFDSNWELSTARANHIGRVLLELHAIPPDRLSAAGYAEFHPVDTNSTAEGRANNRRVDLVVTPRIAINFAAGKPATSNGAWRKITEDDQ
ncbi:MAG TPA: flagellar motor protein MotB [Terracidiphilus sp.]